MAAHSSTPGALGATGTSIRTLLRLAGRAVVHYTRLDLQATAALPPPPALIVMNHGFGGIFDLKVLRLAGVSRELGIDDAHPVTIMTHQLAWTLGVGHVLEAAGFRPASPHSARQAFKRGEYVVVLPGGDVEAAKPWQRRHEVTFGGRTGFARLARDAGVPIVPVVGVGAGESVLVLSDGTSLARRLGLDRLLRLKALPLNVAAPWGLNLGVAGILPYLPLPTKMSLAVLPPLWPRDDEPAESLARRVESTMQATAARLSHDRRVLLGRRR